MTITTATLYQIQAGNHGGFLYATGAATFTHAYTSITGTYLYALAGSGGFSYISASTTGNFKVESSNFNTFRSVQDGGMFWFGGTHSLTVNIPSTTL